MTAVSLFWFEDESPRDLRRWAIAAMIVFGIHAAGVAGYMYLHQPDEIGDLSSPFAIDLAPTADDVDQPEVAPVPEEQQKEVEQPPPPEPSQAVVAQPEEPAPQPIEERKPPAPAVPARSKAAGIGLCPTDESRSKEPAKITDRIDPGDTRCRGGAGEDR